MERQIGKQCKPVQVHSFSRFSPSVQSSQICLLREHPQFPLNGICDALILSRICKKVIVVHRRGTLKATKIYHEPLMKTENVEFLWDSKIIALLHNEKLTGIQIRNVKTGEESTLACDGVFVSVGRKPSTELMKDQIEIDPAGYIIADESTRTNIPGVFAVGDVRTKALRQVVTAVADGATAVHYAEEYLAGGM